MSTAQNTPGGQICTVPLPKTLQRETTKETQKGRRLKCQRVWLEDTNA